MQAPVLHPMRQTLQGWGSQVSEVISDDVSDTDTQLSMDSWCSLDREDVLCICLRSCRAAELWTALGYDRIACVSGAFGRQVSVASQPPPPVLWGEGLEAQCSPPLRLGGPRTYLMGVQRQTATLPEVHSQGIAD